MSARRLAGRAGRAGASRGAIGGTSRPPAQSGGSTTIVRAAGGPAGRSLGVPRGLPNSRGVSPERYPDRTRMQMRSLEANPQKALTALMPSLATLEHCC
eukprot:6702801-Alexandrium_andersonii.AAC.1